MAQPVEVAGDASEKQDEDMSPVAAVAADENPDWEQPGAKEEPGSASTGAQAGLASTGAPSGPSGSEPAAKAAVPCVMCKQIAGSKCIFYACARHCKHLRGDDAACPQHGPFVPLPSLPPPPSKRGGKTP